MNLPSTPPLFCAASLKNFFLKIYIDPCLSDRPAAHDAREGLLLPRVGDHSQQGVGGSRRGRRVLEGFATGALFALHLVRLVLKVQNPSLD